MAQNFIRIGSNMQKTALIDFDKWKNLNKGSNFSLYDYIFHIIKFKEIPSDIFFAFLEFFWPTFIVYKNFVILKEHFSEDRIEDLLRQKENIEYWTNLLLTDSFFQDEENGEEKAEFLAKALAESWQAKLQKDFPNTRFTVKCFCDSETGDRGLTFYQTTI
jgi:hypothetical protein